ncbi:hypothetical protein E4U25_004069 [Claviceps purpurea]|nr:hypothetical protein E4U25_004069 [Claviceps purpurea]
MKLLCVIDDLTMAFADDELHINTAHEISASGPFPKWTTRGIELGQFGLIKLLKVAPRQHDHVGS